MAELKRKREKRQEILSVARKLFLQQGYDATSVRQIAQQLDISLGLVSYYFKTKRDIAVEILDIQMQKQKELLSEYVSQRDDPILYSGALTRLQCQIMSSPRFQLFYKDALREDIYFDQISHSGIDTYRFINEKYQLGLSDDYLILYGNFIAASLERTLVLYAAQNQLVGDIPDMLFLTYMGRFYGSEDFLKECCKKNCKIVERIFKEHPEVLLSWIA